MMMIDQLDLLVVGLHVTYAGVWMLLKERLLCFTIVILQFVLYHIMY